MSDHDILPGGTRIAAGESPASLADLFGPAEGSPASDLVASCARKLLDARRMKDEADAQSKAAGEHVMACESELLRALDAAGLKSVRTDDGTLLSAASSWYYSMPAALLEDNSFILWLRRMGGHDLVKRTVHPGSFRGFCKELVEAGKSLHPAVRSLERRTVSVRRG